ncbi:MAG: DHH family phosphoesterase [Lachnospiraceae bacterium]|nr:DHH family phosphoesterase [Lachnospiraceae bacterium]
MQLKDLLAYSSVIIQCHDFPDADAIASGYAVYTYLKNRGKEVRLVYGGRQEITKPNLVIMVDQLEIPLEYVTELQEAELLLTVDCIYGEGNVTPFPAKQVAVIDHHLCNKPVFDLMEVRSSYGSCASLVAEMLREEGVIINEDVKVATALYYGLYTDTNAFGELHHPADRDLRDFARYDAGVFTLLKNSNLSLEEMQIAGDALKHYRYREEYRFALVQAKPCDPNILGFISDLLLQVDGVDVCVVFCRMPSGLKLSVRSCVASVRAVELLDYVIRGIGSGGGHMQKAGGYIPNSSLLEASEESLREFVSERIVGYYHSFTVLYAKNAPVDTAALPLYQKRPLTVGYIPSLELYPEGTALCVRTLEADLNVTAESDLYLMLGIFGEVYPIRRAKFEASYEVTEQVPEILAEYRPMVISQAGAEVKELLPHAKGCIPKVGVPIYAKQLTKAVKVYTAWDEDNYMYGRPGDYLAVRQDDPKDVYVIGQRIFEKTYERV